MPKTFSDYLVLLGLIGIFISASSLDVRAYPELLWPLIGFSFSAICLLLAYILDREE